jgi:hypothetical protein
MKAFLLKNAEVRNDDPFKEGDTYPVSPQPDKESLKVPYNLALNQYNVLSSPNNHETNMSLGCAIFPMQQPSVRSSPRGLQHPSSQSQAARLLRVARSPTRI